MVVSELALRAFSRKLGSADPTPGGGSASAAAGAMAAGLVRMVAQLTACSPKYEEFALRATSIADRAEHVMETLLQSVDEDAAAFDEVAAAFKLPRSNDAEKSARTAAIQAALLGAAEPPLRVIGASLEACRLAAELVDFGNANAISDIGCAALFANAAAQGAALNVEINVKNLKDRAVAGDYEDRVRSALAQVDLLTEVVLGKVQTALTAST